LTQKLTGWEAESLHLQKLQLEYQRVVQRALRDTRLDCRN